MRRYIVQQGSPRPTDKGLSIPYQESLNPAQYEAATTLQGPLLVIAGAGSGKTRTLTYRVARLVEQGVSPSSVLLLTFTRKASQEMLGRAAALLDHRCENVSGGTFHSFANLILRRYAERIGFGPGFSILDRTDAEDAINVLRTRMGLNLKDRRFPRKRTIANIYSKAVNKGAPIGEIILEDYPHFLGDSTDILRLYEAYQAYKRRNLLMDYDDLLIYLRDLLQQHMDVQEILSETYQYIMVDEYQDTNKMQADIVRFLAATHNNVMVVGDDSQSIYAFRGANFRNIMDFPQMFPGTKMIKLEENYRSTQPILDVANAIIDGAGEKYTKILFTNKKTGPLPALVVAEDEHMQSQFVSQRILELHEEGIPLNEIAVLFRSSYHAFDLEIELNRRNVPFIKVGGFKFMESAHIKDLLAHLKVLANPLDSISWHRVLLMIEGVGPKTAEEIFECIVSSGEGLKGLSAVKAKARCAPGFERLKKQLQDLSDVPMPLEEIGLRLLEYYEPILERKYDDYPKRLKDLEQLMMIMERYQHMEHFLSDMALEPPNTSVENVLTTEYESEQLVLSTIHSAKGLEWHTVFVIWALEGRFPVSFAFRSNEEMEEERRLMYVAATRARENLYFTCPAYVDDWGMGSGYARLSRFIEGIPEDILEPWSLVID
jgi:DNA helicase-2/ATP-dependent DNA helicase PcrA